MITLYAFVNGSDDVSLKTQPPIDQRFCLSIDHLHEGSMVCPAISISRMEQDGTEGQPPVEL